MSGPTRSWSCNRWARASAGCGEARAEVREEARAQLERLTARGEDLRTPGPWFLGRRALRVVGTHEGVPRAQLHPPNEQLGVAVAEEPADVRAGEGDAGESEVQELWHR